MQGIRNALGSMGIGKSTSNTHGSTTTSAGYQFKVEVSNIPFACNYVDAV
jgi:hypothetical protein